MLPKWTVPTNYQLANLTERTTVSIPLPLESLSGVTTSVISGVLPGGIRLEDNELVGTTFEVARTTNSTFVIRATTDQGILDRTFKITVEGSDNPLWVTPEGGLPIGPNGVYFILDSSLIDFQLLATDNDLPAGDILEYYIADGDGELPPGITLTSDGRLTGIVDPLLALDINALNGGYDTGSYGSNPFDFNVLSGSGLDSFYYDTTGYDYFVPTRVPRKLNRNYEFQVTVADNVSSTKRRFQIYVVGDDFTRADNTLMKAADGVFTADITYVRVPVWLTPSDLGVRRANNYVTLFLETLDQNTTAGVIKYILEPINNDGSVSTLPPGLEIDQDTGELAGVVPYQPAVTKEYKFTVNALRYNAEQGVVTVFATYFDDILSGNKTIKVAKLPTGTQDGITDLQSLIGKEVVIEDRYYTIESVNDANTEYDTVTFSTALEPIRDINPLTVSRAALGGQSYFFINNLTESDRNFYKNKVLNFTATSSNIIDTVYPYIEWRITIDDSAGNIELDTGITGTTGGPSITGILSEALDFENYPAYISSTSGVGGINELVLTIPATSQNRSINYIRSLFHTSDSAVVNVEELSSFDRIGLDSTLTNELTLGRQFNFGVTRGGSFSRTFPRAEIEVIEKKKTFDIRILGEVDSTITWLTPDDLGVLPANRISTLFLQAQSTVADAVLKYNITSGRLPAGLTLKSDGEIVGKVRINDTPTELGLTFFDSGATTFDGGTTSIDREYIFTVLARDRFGFSAVSKTFTLRINDSDDLLYSNIYVKPYMHPTIRTEFNQLISDSKIIPPRLVYRGSDPNFGIQKYLKSLIYAGIETQDIATFVAATSKNHKRKKFLIGDLKTAVAKNPGENNTVYEVVYLELKDPAKPVEGKARKTFQHLNSNNRITVDSVKYESKDDVFNGRDGSISYVVNTRNDGQISIQLFNSSITVSTRDGTPYTIGEDNSLTIYFRDSSSVTLTATVITPVTGISAPYRLRPIGDVITADTDAIKSSQRANVKKWLSNIDNMRDNIKDTGKGSRDFLPLWMRTAQNGSLSELDYVLAIPLVYCKAGESETIRQNIENANFDFKQINYDVDRYIIDSTTGNSNEQYIVFANYPFNV